MNAFLKSGKLSADSAGASGSSTKKSTTKKAPVPWVEKYRPKTVADVVEQSDAVAVLQQCMSGADLPNLLFYGPPGTGKTSTILAAAHQLFGDMYRQRILELNASDERGIQVIREKVKTFSQITASGTRPDGKPCPPFKIVILDEADSMTNAAQAALRRTMEKQTLTTRFCLICNYVSRIIEPLTSRCTIFRFKPLQESMIYERLKFICTEEKVECNDESLNTLVETSGGDMRRAITCLQSCAKLTGQYSPIKIDHVYEVTGVIPKEWVDNFMKACASTDYNELRKYIEKMLYQAYSSSTFLEQFNEYMIKSKKLDDKQKACIGQQLGLISFRLQDGGSEYVQLLDLGITVMKALKMKTTSK